MEFPSNIFHSLPTLDPDDIRPVCVKILDAEDHIMKDITSYDAELYHGNNDGNFDYLTPIDINHIDHISTHQLYTSVNLAQIDNSTKTYFQMKSYP